MKSRMGLLFVCVFLCLCCGITQAQDKDPDYMLCSASLDKDLKNLIHVSEKTDLATAATDYMCQQARQKREQGSTNLGFTVSEDGTPNLNVAQSNESSDNYHQYCETHTKTLTDKQARQALSVVAPPDVVKRAYDSYDKCVEGYYQYKQSSKDLVYLIEKHEGADVFISAHWNPNEYSRWSSLFPPKTTVFDYSGGTCVNATTSFVPGKPINTGREVHCTVFPDKVLFAFLVTDKGPTKPIRVPYPTRPALPTDCDDPDPSTGICRACVFKVGLTLDTGQKSQPFVCRHMPPNVPVRAEFQGNWNAIEETAKHWLDVSLETPNGECTAFTECWGRKEDPNPTWVPNAVAEQALLRAYGTTSGTGESSWVLTVRHCERAPSTAAKCSTVGDARLRVEVYKPMQK